MGYVGCRIDIQFTERNRDRARPVRIQGPPRRYVGIGKGSAEHLRRGNKGVGISRAIRERITREAPLIAARQYQGSVNVRPIACDQVIVQKVIIRACLSCR